MTATETKLRCNKCEEYLPTESFARNNRQGDRGYQYACRACASVRAKQQNLKKYNLTIHQFQELWERHNEQCSICSKKLFLGGPSGYAIDHNHNTGEVRGLLCQLCNQGLGCLQDSPEVLKSALKYLYDNGHYGR